MTCSACEYAQQQSCAARPCSVAYPAVYTVRCQSPARDQSKAGRREWCHLRCLLLLSFDSNQRWLQLVEERYVRPECWRPPFFLHFYPDQSHAPSTILFRPFSRPALCQGCCKVSPSPPPIH